MCMISYWNTLNKTKFYRKQIVYRKKHSTELGTLHLVDEISKQNDNGNMAGALYIDLSKAFHTLNHAVLLSKMKSYGIKSLTINWFEDYLFHRAQICKINIVTLSYQVWCASGLDLRPNFVFIITQWLRKLFEML